MTIIFEEERTLFPREDQTHGETAFGIAHEVLDAHPEWRKMQMSFQLVEYAAGHATVHIVIRDRDTINWGVLMWMAVVVAILVALIGALPS